MSREKRQQARIRGTLECYVTLRDIASGKILAGPIAGIVNNISKRGAGVSLAVIRIDSYHLFYSVLDNAEWQIVMEVSSPGKHEECMLIIAVPVWFDRDLANATFPFVMGLQFFSGTVDEQLQIFIEQNFQTKRSEDKWWQKCFIGRIVKAIR